MSNDTQKKENAAAASPKWVDFNTDRELVSFEACEKKGLTPTLEGWLLGTERIKEATDDMPPFDCLNLLLTKDVELINKDGNKYKVPKGTALLVPKSSRLTGLADISMHPIEVYQVQIVPGETVPIGGGKKMRKFQVKINPTPGERKLIAPQSAAKLSAGAAAHAALPPAPFE